MEERSSTVLTPFSGTKSCHKRIIIIPDIMWRSLCPHPATTGIYFGNLMKPKMSVMVHTWFQVKYYGWTSLLYSWFESITFVAKWYTMPHDSLSTKFKHYLFDLHLVQIKTLSVPSQPSLMSSVWIFCQNEVFGSQGFLWLGRQLHTQAAGVRLS